MFINANDLWDVGAIPALSQTDICSTCIVRSYPSSLLSRWVVLTIIS